MIVSAGVEEYETIGTARVDFDIERAFGIVEGMYDEGVAEKSRVRRLCHIQPAMENAEALMEVREPHRGDRVGGSEGLFCTVNVGADGGYESG